MSDLHLELDSTDGKAELEQDQLVKWVKKNILIPDQNGGLAPTNAFGKVQFKGAMRRATAKFARVGVKTKDSVIFKLLKEVWELENPLFLLSVTGGAKNFSLNSEIQEQFTSGLVKVAQTPGAWIITGGTNTGVMKHVGEALQRAKNPCIGIATWGIVTNARALEVKDGEIGGTHDYQVACSLLENGAFLDHNHTHHILVDDGSTENYGREIPLRSKIEKYIMKEANVPSVLMVVGGGSGTLNTVLKALTEEPPLPVVVIVGSGRAADLLAYAYKEIEDIDAYNDSECPEGLLSKAEELFRKSEKEERNTYCKKVLGCMKKKDYVTMFEISNKNGIDEAILKTILRGGRTLTLYEQLKLTLLWDRADLAKDCISQCSTFEEKDLTSAMIMALAMDRVDFVKLFLQYRINITTLLKEDVLGFLYGYRSQDAHSILKKIIKDGYKPAKGDYEDVMKQLCKYENYKPDAISLSFDEICRIKQKASSAFVRQKTKGPKKEKNQQNDPNSELFFFALLCNMPKMARYMWNFEEESLLKAFLCIEINIYLAKTAKKHDFPDDIKLQVEQNISDFRKLCTDLLGQCFKTDRDKTKQLITSSSLQFNSQTCLSLAVLTDHKEFFSHNAVQTFMNEVWGGRLKDSNISWKQYFLAYIFPPYICTFEFLKDTSHAQNETETKYNPPLLNWNIDTKTEETAIVENSSDSTKLLRKSASYSSIIIPLKDVEKKPHKKVSPKNELPKYVEMSPCTKILTFYFHTPSVKFMSNLFSYLCFLVLFAYVSMLKKDTTTPSTAEWILVLYIVSFTIEEILQVIQDEALTLKKKLLHWWSSNWNRLDGIALIVFYVGLALRFNQTTLNAAHVLYAIDAWMWVIRLLNNFYVDDVLGPYVVMIYKMLLDMRKFLLILFVFLVAYGVSAASILKPQVGDPKMILDAIFHPYFNIYGELFVDRDPSNDNTTRFGTAVINSYSEPLAWTLLGSYLLIANVLLLNLLIAIFNNTYQDVKSNSKQIWNFERYHLIKEYVNRPLLVPPFLLLYPIYMLIVFGFGGSQQKKNSLNFKGQHELDVMNEFENECKSKIEADRLN